MPPAGRCLGVRVFVTSDGIGGTGLPGEVPLGDGRACDGPGGAPTGLGSGRGPAGSGIVSSFGGRGKGAPQRPRRPPGAAADRDAAMQDWDARMLSDAEQGRRWQLPRAAVGRRGWQLPRAAGGHRYRSGPAASWRLCGVVITGIHHAAGAARPGLRPGGFDQAPSSRPGRGAMSVMSTNGRNLRTDAHALLR
jgi:hypothetical protein